MAQIPHDELQIFPLTQRYRLSSFNSTSSELNEFLTNDALEDQENMISRTYLCFWRETLVGYITLLADTIGVQSIDEDERVVDYQYTKYPAIKIGRVAVGRSFERIGIGRFLLLAAIGKSISISKEIGCRYITVDSKVNSIDFYKKHNFKEVEGYSSSEFPKMYLNMYPIYASIKPKESLEEFEN
ncbi:MAG: GNAT family N-acetyltransferase [Candidatus Methanoperedens sp.]|nr:GNAT family N-acetyltransferase [Candidatus Methanoperedens sp.]